MVYVIILNMKHEISNRDREIIAFIIDHTDYYAKPPTTKEIREAVGIKTAPGILRHLSRLTNLGYIEIDAIDSRTIRVTY